MCKVKDCSSEGRLVRGYCNKHYRRLMAHGNVHANKKKNPLSFDITETGCFECTSHKPSVNGYPQACINKRTTRLNRFVYEEMFGEIPEGMVVRHTCDNRKCINPEHLVLGTQQENIKDMDERGRRKTVVGEDSHFAVLDEKTVRQIKRMILYGFTNKDLMEIFDVSKNMFDKIKYNRTWKHVEVGEVICVG